MEKPIDIRLADLRELTLFPDIVDAIASMEGTGATLDIDLGPLAATSPFALAEAVLLARTTGVTLLLVPTK